MALKADDPAWAIGEKVEAFVRTTIIPYESDPRRDHHGAPTEELVRELRALARAEGLMTPHILPDGAHLTQEGTAYVLIRSGLSPLGPVALNTMAPDEGNMYLLGHVAAPHLKERFLAPLVSGEARSAFFMTEPAEWGGAGSDPMMMKTTCRKDGNHWIINGRKAFITGADGARVGIVMAKSEDPDSAGGACMFLVDLPDPAIRIVDVPNTIDTSMPGSHATVEIKDLRVPADQMLGEAGEGFRYAQVRLSPARLSHCMRWLGCCIRAQEIATDYACRREAFGKTLIDHEGVGFLLAQNRIDLKQAQLMIEWCASVLDEGGLGTQESSMAKVAVSEALMRIADNCVQVMGGNGLTDKTVVEQIFREVRAFRVYDGPTEVHKWSLAKKIKREWREAQVADAGQVRA
ncbi:acyl-CoA dehydrogenase family protein [Novosphingobium decolorationis]|uniref:Acyl-CoA dehydrogenase n=1 Tax=Novosphingobium decolorationis TaxID=2698673 RepID=A0ABX8E0G5_9SPHN|nr:acyl-CoA dehydrogenase [Novosphingobium decolorationis]MED5546700.1 acyl-CoA dehydrogenase [Pseudomonadota bacterium]QVM82620.1 acyl-CoA dehydrogenase [Novosphingobium decolorationis]